MRGLFVQLALALSLAMPAVAAPICNVDSELGKQLNLPIYEWVDNDVPKKGVIVAVHGMTFYAQSFDNIAKYLASRGYRFIAADMRGFGRWKDEGETFGGDTKVHFSESENDLVKIIQKVRADDPDANIICMGESLGANIALWFLSVHPELVDAGLLSAPGVKPHIHPRWRWVSDLVTGLRHPKSPMHLEPYITPYLAEDPSIAASCLKDPRMTRALSPVELVKAHVTNSRCLKQAQQIPNGMPVLVLAGQKDRIYQTKALVSYLKDLNTKHISLKVFPDKGHLLLEHQELDPNIAKLIGNWLDKSEAEIAEAKQRRAPTLSITGGVVKPAEDPQVSGL